MKFFFVLSLSPIVRLNMLLTKQPVAWFEARSTKKQSLNQVLICFELHRVVFRRHSQITGGNLNWQFAPRYERFISATKCDVRVRMCAIIDGELCHLQFIFLKGNNSEHGP